MPKPLLAVTAPLWLITGKFGAGGGHTSTDRCVSLLRAGFDQIDHSQLCQLNDRDLI
jgi:hypothetical protein